MYWWYLFLYSFYFVFLFHCVTRWHRYLCDLAASPFFPILSIKYGHFIYMWRSGWMCMFHSPAQFLFFIYIFFKNFILTFSSCVSLTQIPPRLGRHALSYLILVSDAVFLPCLDIRCRCQCHMHKHRSYLIHMIFISSHFRFHSDDTTAWSFF